MRTRRLPRIAIGVALVGAIAAFMPPSAQAVEGCRVKVNTRDGTLLVSAKNVGANPRWGFTPAIVTAPFTNEATCVGGGVAKNCVLGEPGTAPRITPPDLCTLYVTDDSATICAAYIKGCVPGVRDAAQGPPGPPGAPGSPGQPGPPGPGLVVKDGNGVVVGIAAVDDNGQVLVTRDVGGVVVRFRALPSALQGTTTAFYESAGCVGSPLMTQDAPDVLVGGSIIVGTTLYYHVGPDSFIPYQSSNDGSGCVNSSGTREHGPTAAVDLSAFVPPFHVEVQ